MDIKIFLQSSYKKENFIEFIYDKFYGFEENSFGYEQELLSDTEKKHIQKYKFLGNCNLDDGKELGFFEVITTDNIDIENNRVSLNNILKKKAEDELLDGAIAVFTNPSKPNIWRLSFIRFSYDENDKQQVTNLKRFTFVLGENIPIKTAYQQLQDLKYPKLNEIEEAFSVEKISKEFFIDYKKLYFELCDYLKPQLVYFKCDKNIKLFTKKMLGRIVFLYFLEKKGWLGSDDNWKNGDKKFLTNHFNKYNGEDFYTNILQPIFFEALNTNREDRNHYFEKLDCKMPFLNGGLFSQDEFDKKDIIIEDKIFEDIFKTFDSYNFTIIEDIPDDSEVAIDPEVLGRVFEDLLEDRKDKGAFYTPREIVHYMCKQSINNYLETKPENENELEYLKKITILDPAIGSGAFPMGMLHELIEKRVLLGDKTSLSELKKEIIQNSIYGIDIEPSAVEIAKLRFWLSIVVDEDNPTPLPNLFYKIMVGNSLIETINGFDPLEKDELSLFDDKEEDIENINILLDKFFNVSDKNKKQEYQNDIENRIDNILNIKLDKYEDELKNQLNQKNIFKLNSKIIEEKNYDIKLIENVKKRPTTELFFYKIYFAEVMNNGGFDVVIGNPPYLRVQGIDKQSSEQYKKIFNSATGSYDLYVLFTEKALELLSNNGIVNFIMPHKWINASFGKGLRILAKDKIYKFISFGAYQVFNASTYTSLVWLQNNKTNKHLDYVELNRNLTTNQELEKYLIDLNDDSYTKINNKDLTADNWIFTNKKTYEILEKIKSQPLSIKDIFKYTSQGVVTTGNDIFYLKGNFNKDKFIGFSKALNKEIILERDIVKPILLGKDVKRYDNKLKNQYFVIYPHHIIENKTKPFTEKYLKDNYPLTYKYLINFKIELIAKKIKYKNNPDDWFSLTRPREIEIYEQNKIITPQLSIGGYFTYDTNNIYIDAGCYSFIKHKNINESYKYYMTILNSKVCWFFIKNTSVVFSGGYFYYKPIYLNYFKIPKIENIEDTKPFEILVDYIMFTKEHGMDIECSLFEAVIDNMVYDLYFEEDMKKADCFISDRIKELDLKSFDIIKENELKKEYIKVVYEVFQTDQVIKKCLIFSKNIDTIKIINGK